MIERFEREFGEWMIFAQDLGISGVRIGDNTRDPQRRRLSYCIAREVLVQCREVEKASCELLKIIREISNFMDDTSEDPQKVKKLKR